jgi:DNA-directed RNA polymerase subunit L
MSADTIPIELTLAERHTLTDLLTEYIDERVFEDVKFARYSIDLEKAANRESIAQLRRMSTVDYAHKCVCERIVAQIDAAREQVPA